MLKEFKTYKKKIDNIFANQKNNIPQLELELEGLIHKAKKLQNTEWAKSNATSNKYWGTLADSRFQPTYDYLKNCINNSTLPLSDEFKCFIEIIPFL